MAAEQAQGAGRRYAILTHDHPFFHWDLLLERDEVAWTWRLLDDPSGAEAPRTERIGERIKMNAPNVPIKFGAGMKNG